MRHLTCRWQGKEKFLSDCIPQLCSPSNVLSSHTRVTLFIFFIIIIIIIVLSLLLFHPLFSRKDPDFDPESFNGSVVCEKPNNNLNHFKCYV